MPVYEYECQKCGHRFEVWQSANDAPLTICEIRGCHGKVQKVFHPVGIIFKGTGWHITDYRGNGGNGKKAKETASTEKEKKEEKEEA